MITYCVTLENKHGDSKREIVKARNLDQAMDRAESQGWTALSASPIGFNPPFESYQRTFAPLRSDWRPHVVIGALIAGFVLLIIYYPL